MPAEPVRHRLTSDEFHDERPDAVTFLDAVNGRNVGMVERSEPRASRSKRASRSGSAVNARGRILMATSRRSLVSCARYTSPIADAQGQDLYLIDAEAPAGQHGGAGLADHRRREATAPDPRESPPSTPAGPAATPLPDAARRRQRTPARERPRVRSRYATARRQASLPPAASVQV